MLEHGSKIYNIGTIDIFFIHLTFTFYYAYLLTWAFNTSNVIWEAWRRPEQFWPIIDTLTRQIRYQTTTWSWYWTFGTNRNVLSQLASLIEAQLGASGRRRHDNICGSNKRTVIWRHWLDLECHTIWANWIKQVNLKLFIYIHLISTRL